VVFIEHAAGTGIDSAFDEHPGTRTQQGVARVKEILDALMKGDAWKSSVFIITYDEAGGLYDHVPIVPAPAPDNIQPIASPGFGRAARRLRAHRFPHPADCGIAVGEAAFQLAHPARPHFHPEVD
jgi:hypothetical protein